jgi:hypothetical protein
MMKQIDLEWFRVQTGYSLPSEIPSIFISNFPGKEDTYFCLVCDNGVTHNIWVSVKIEANELLKVDLNIIFSKVPLQNWKEITNSRPKFYFLLSWTQSHQGYYSASTMFSIENSFGKQIRELKFRETTKTTKTKNFQIYPNQWYYCYSSTKLVPQTHLCILEIGEEKEKEKINFRSIDVDIWLGLTPQIKLQENIHYVLNPFEIVMTTLPDLRPNVEILLSPIPLLVILKKQDIVQFEIHISYVE